MSGLTDAMIINGVVLAVILEADLGPHRKIGWFRIGRPLITAGAIVPLYFAGFSTHGTGLILEIAGTVAGVLVGVAAGVLMRVYRSPRTGKAVSRAGFAYAALWIAVVGARAAFSWGSVHWFGPQLGSWMASNAVTVDALTDALLLMALAMTLTRTFGLAARAARLPALHAATRAAAAPEPSRNQAS